MKTTFTSVNEKNKFVPAKEVNGFRFEGALQHPFGDDVSLIHPLRSSGGLYVTAHAEANEKLPSSLRELRLAATQSASPVPACQEGSRIS